MQKEANLLNVVTVNIGLAGGKLCLFVLTA
jgi:hypothetical protein